MGMRNKRPLSYYNDRTFENSVQISQAQETLESVHSAIAQRVQSTYRSRQFDGDKFSGGMNDYSSSHGLNLLALRARSMQAYTESMQGRAAVVRLNDTVINTGLSLESTPEATILGLSQEERKEKSGEIEARFNLWSSSKDCDVSRENNLGQMEKIQFNNQLVKGDYFALLPYSNDPNLINPLQVKLIRPELVSTPSSMVHLGDIQKRGNYLFDGIEYDRNDKEVAIFLKVKKSNRSNIWNLPTITGGQKTQGFPGTDHNGQFIYYDWVRIPKYGPVSGRQILIHGKTQEFGFEHRGVPALAHVAHELEKITDYSLLELMAAVANATIAAVVVPSDKAPATNPMPGNSFIPPSLIKAANGFTATDSNLDSGYTNIGKNVLKNTGGLLISSLNAGEKYESHDTKRPNVNFETFVDSVTKYLASTLSMPIEVLHMTFGQNFSASRASLKLYWQSLDVRRHGFVSDFLTPVYNSWLLGEVGTGNIILKNFENPISRIAWQSAKWIGVPSPSIDPVKEEKAAKMRVEEGFSTREQEAQSRNGSSFDSNVDRLTSENKRLAAANEPLIKQPEIQGVPV